ncbi:MAG TPA: glycosyl hydrolase [Lentisphaeria bacterium]|nr:MAG: hypothetical protein A2X48_09845 [Lentisphaerae bacterium GWF2_49_21]HBC87811.1 glycosyl hydrolase [Lentisphaeria bacterium]
MKRSLAGKSWRLSLTALATIMLTLSSSLFSQDKAAAPTSVSALPSNTGPFGIASGAEWSKDYPKFNPLLNQAGVRWIRYFPEWQTIQPKKGEWSWSWADAFVADATKNNIHVTGCFGYFAPWASADGGTRKGPVKDIQFWKDYVSGSMTRYQKEIKTWEVWNEFNGSFYQGINKPKEYAALVVAAYDEAKKISPDIKIGMSCANFDLGFFDAAIKEGAGGHFDFIAVHPYENLGAVMGDGAESGFLSMADSIRKMLSDNKQKADMPLWITEIGYQAPIKPNPEKDALQAEAIVKAYILSSAQGFERLCWFEARGPAYGHGTDHGIIREDWTLRPAYDALKTMTGLLGESPKYLGWLNMEKNGYGFAFQGKDTKVLATWSPPGATNKIKFESPVKIIDLTGKTTTLDAGKEFDLTRMPVFIIDLPKKLADLAESQIKKPFPWGTDYSKVDTASCKLGATNDDKGIKQVRMETTAVENGLTETWRRSNFKIGGEGRYIYFRVDPTFASFGSKDLEITIVARRTAPDKKAVISLLYESLKGYKGAPGGNFEIPADDQWHENTWKVNDANFVGGWGWNFRTEATGSPNEFFIKEARVKKSALANTMTPASAPVSDKK